MEATALRKVYRSMNHSSEGFRAQMEAERGAE
jgi:hypothetical protein